MSNETGNAVIGAAAVTHEIVQHLAVISTPSPTGWSKELNLVKWGGKEAKYDIRDWSSDHHRMSRGITLRPDEAEALRTALNNAFAK